MKIKFNISGNQDDPEGNPVPYVRSTRYGQFNPNVARYNEWKDYVRKCFWRSDNLNNAAMEKLLLNVISGEKPIRYKANQQAQMEIKIFWKNRAHGDPDNIWKGICDALFVNDRNVDGSFESQLAPDGKGRVEVKIVIR